MVQAFRYNYSETEIKKILDSMMIIIDSRERKSEHIKLYLDSKKVVYKTQKLDFGDYSCMIPADEELGIRRDIYLNSFVERKNGVDEITGNLQKSTQQAFINELIRSQGSKFVIFVEEPDFDEKIARGAYISGYDPKALKGRLESLKARYNFEICAMSKDIIGHNIYHRFYYQMKEYLKTGAI